MPKGLLLGWHNNTAVSPSFGFNTPVQATDPLALGAPVCYDDEGHLITIAPTGAGKGVGSVIPAILLHDGPVIVMDIKGENYAMTKRHREALGSKVVCIDPFGIVARMSDTPNHHISGFNPFDMLPYLSDDHDTACRALADLLIAQDGHKNDPFWRDAAVSVLAALIDCYNSFEGPMRSISAIAQDLATEVEKSNHAGDIPKSAQFFSYAHADHQLMDALKTHNISLDTVYAMLEYSQRGYLWKPSRTDIISAIKEAVRLGMDCKDPPRKGKKRKEVVESLAKQVYECEFARERFTERFAACQAPDGLADKIWALFVQAGEAYAEDRAEGSFAASAGYEDPPQNYPLALHRVARHASAMCRSAAAQPFTVERTWGSIMCTLRVELAQYSGMSMARTFGGHDPLNMESLRQGDNISLYIAFPPTRLQSHRSLFRAMVEGILAVLMARTQQPKNRTLLVLDEVAQLGHMPLLLTAKTLLRGYGVQVWSIWQDISQLKGNYPDHWQTLLNNCRVIQTFGKGSGVLVADLSKALDVAPGTIANLTLDDALVWINGQPPLTVRRAVCYSDPLLRDLCDPNMLSAAGRAHSARTPAPHTQATPNTEHDVRSWANRMMDSADDPADLIATAARLQAHLTQAQADAFLADNPTDGDLVLKLLRSWAHRPHTTHGLDGPDSPNTRPNKGADSDLHGPAEDTP